MQKLWQYLLRRSALALVVLASVVFISLILVAVNVTQKLEASELKVVGESYQAAVANRAQDLQGLLADYANNSLLINALVDYNGREAYLPTYVENLSLTTGEKSPLAVTDFAGEVIADNGLPGLAAFERSNWQDSVLVRGQAWQAVLHTDLLMATPIKIIDSVEGAVITRIPLSYLANLGAFDDGETAFLLLQDGRVIYKSNGPWVLQANLPEHTEGWRLSPLVPSEELRGVLARPIDYGAALGSSAQTMLLASVFIVALTFIAVAWVMIAAITKLLNGLQAAMARQDVVEEQITNEVEELFEVVSLYNRTLTELIAATTSKAQLQAILDGVDAAIVLLDDDCCIQSINKIGQRNLSLSTGELLQGELARLNDLPESAQYELHYQGIDWLWRRRRQIDLNGQHQGYVLAGTDITEVRQTRQQLDLLRQAVESASSGILVAEATPQQPLIFVNRGFEEITGYRREEVLGRKCNFLQGPETDWQVAHDLGLVVARGEAASVEIYNYKKDGTSFWNHLSITPVVNQDGQPTHYIGVQSDITERVLNRQRLKEARQEAEAASRLKSEFVANMSHEIRTPMNAIMGLADLLSDTQLSDQQRDYLDKISLSSQGLLSIINDILDFSKIEADKLEVNEYPLRLSSLLNQLCAMFAEQSRTTGLDIWFEVNPCMADDYIGDSQRILQILINLLGNALKFTKQGCVRVIIVPQTGGLTIQVVDTGIGMSEAQKAQLFRAFQQADATISREFGGTGLGLAISLKLAYLMGGELTVESEQGVGSRFILWLPLRPTSADRQPPAKTIALAIQDSELRRYLEQFIVYTGWQQVSEHYDYYLSDDPDDQAATLVIGRDLNRPFTPFELLAALTAPAKSRVADPTSAQLGYYHANVLLAEDNAINRQIATELLARVGITPTVVEDGQQAVDKLLKQPFDLVLMDIQMPHLDGLAATKIVRERGVSTPIIALTANALVDDQVESKQAGMNDHLSKPFAPQALYALLAKYLQPAGHFNPNQALKQTAGNQDVLKQVSELFVSEHRDDIEKAGALWPEESEAALRLIHTLKGLTEMLFDAPMVEAVKQLEAQMKSGEAQIDFAEVGAQMALRIAGLEAWLAQQG